MPKRHLFANLALAASSLALTLGLLEVGLRIARARRGGGKEEGSEARYTEYDPVLGWRKTPGGRGSFNRREYRVEAVINGHGLRDHEHDYEAPPGSFRILTLGDSFVEGYGVEARDTATEVMEAALARPGCPVEAINGGTIGYSTDQEYLFYREEGVRYAPQVVALFFYSNDVRFNNADSYFGLPKPRLVARDGRLELKTQPLPERAFKRRRQRGLPPPPPPPPAQGSAVAEWVKERLLLGAPRTYAALAHLGLWRPLRVLPPKPEMQVYWKDAPPYFDRAWQATRQILDALRAEVASHGAHLVVVYVPSRMEVRDRDWELTRLQYGLDERWDRDLARQHLLDLGHALEIPVLDLTAALRREERGVLGGPYYVYDGHWNPLGHRIAAHELIAFLRQRSWLPACSEAPS